MAEGVTVANAFVQIMPSMEGATDNITNAILPGIGAAGDKAGASFGSMFTGKIGTMLKGAGVAAIGYLAFDNLKDAFVEVEAGFNNVIIATGATGEAAEELRSVYTDVAGSVVGSFEDIGSAVGELNTRFGLQGEALEAASEQAMKYAKITGQDATTAIQDVSRMMNNAGISADNYAHILDVLTVAGQQAGIDVGKLATTVTENAATFRELGFSTEESIAMLAQFEKAGVNTSQVLAGMKKGVAEWNQEGISAKEGFEQFVQGVQDGSVTSADAIDLFGARAGMAMYDAAAQGQLAWDDMYTAIQENSDGALDTVYNSTLTAQEKFDVLGKKVQTGFYEIVEPIIDAISPYMDDIIAIVSDGVEWFVNEAVPKIKMFIKIVQELVNGLSKLANDFQDTADKANAFASDVSGFVSGTVQDIIGWWSSLPGNISSFVQQAYNSVTETFNRIVQFVQSIPERIVGFFYGIGQRITNAIGSIHFPQPHVSWGNISIADVWSVPIPYVSWYARGGIVDGAQLIGAGEAGPEAIIPLTEPNIRPFSQAVANELSGEIDGLREELRQMRLVLNIDGRAFAEATVDEIDRAMGAKSRRAVAR